MPPLDKERKKRKEEFDLITGTVIKNLRSQFDYSQHYVAEQADMSVSTLSRIEYGERSLSLQQAIVIARALHVGVADLIDPKTVEKKIRERLSRTRAA